MENKIKFHVNEILKNLEINSCSCIEDTPKRVSNWLIEFTQSHRNSQKPKIIKFNNTFKNNLIKIDKIMCYSLCEHHMLPFFGFIEIEYIPDKFILGLSKFNKICDYLSKKLQTQEKLTNDICNFIFEILEPKKITVKSTMQHTCITMRKIGNYDSKTIIIAEK